QFLTGSSDGTVYLWDSYTGGELARLRGHADGVTCAAFAPDGKQILTGSNDSTARLWDRHTARELAVLRTGYQVTSVAFAPDGRYLLTGSTDGSVHLWDRSTFSELACLRAHTSAVRSMAFAPHGQVVLTCDASGRVFFWRIASSISATPIGLYIAHYEIAAISWSDAHHLLLADAGGPGGRPHVYDLSLEGMS
ncbi:MAG TPA: cytochrome D1 domain-containing protein, partial [Ktedonobacteraceae bacterium]|nr:cytochrome D1 domain-containing protein [Ktedonobacteraceae bacterium]